MAGTGPGQQATSSSTPHYYWVTTGAPLGTVWHWAGPYTPGDSATIWIWKDASVPGRTSSIYVNGLHHSSVLTVWPSSYLETGVRTNTISSSATLNYGSSSSLSYWTLNNQNHAGWDTLQRGNPQLAAAGNLGTSAYWVAIPSWMRAYNNTPSNGCYWPAMTSGKG